MKELARHLMVDFLPMKDFAENPLILTEGGGSRSPTWTAGASSTG